MNLAGEKKNENFNCRSEDFNDQRAEKNLSLSSPIFCDD